MQRPWLQHYPKNVPTEISPDRYSSLGDLLDQAFTRHAQRDAYVFMDKRFSFAQIDAWSRTVAAWLQSRGLKRGARVALMMPNIPQYPVCIAAVLRAGYVVVNVNPLYTPRELAHQLHDSGAEAIVLLENFANTLERVPAERRPRHVVVASMGDLLGLVKGTMVNLVVRRVKKMVPAWNLPGAVSFRQVLRDAAGQRPDLPELGHDDLAFLQYTGGTTGVAKGAMLTHRNLIANVLQVDEWSRPALATLPPGKQINIVSALPLYHIFALTVCGLFGLHSGMRNLLIVNPRDTPGLIRDLRKTPPNVFPSVNTMFNVLADNAEFALLDFSGLALTFGGGMSVHKSVAEKWLKVTGGPIIEGYGLSETSPVAVVNPCDTDEYSGAIGMPVPSTDVAIVDDDGRALPLGETGEIAIKGPQVMKGYWNRPDDTADAMTSDGFFKTGDIGIMDERGYIRIVDRKKDMILVSGFNVYPNEVEDVVTQHPGVQECAAVGVPDEHSGEAVKIFVVRKDPELTEAALRMYCRDNLTGYKRPRHIEFRDDLPKTNVGKILRRALRDEAGKSPASAQG